MSFTDHPLLKGPPLDQREYQITVATACLRASTLVVLPTGLGKTIIALWVMLGRLDRGRVLFLAPTKPLAQQHATFLDAHLDLGVKLFTGAVAPAKRAPLWKEVEVIVATPQVVERDLLRGAASLADFALVVFDEAHRAVGEYAYVMLGERYRAEARDPLVLGMTASPGSTRREVLDVCRNLGLTHIEKRNDFDADVLPYVQPIKTHWRRVPMAPAAAAVARELTALQMSLCGQLKRQGYLTRSRQVSTTMLLEAGQGLQTRLRSAGPKPSPQFYQLLSVQAMALKLAHAIQVVETQGLTQFIDYARRLRRDSRTRGASRATRQLVTRDGWQRALRAANAGEADHPKLVQLIEIVTHHLARGDERIIVFANYRHTASLVVKRLAELDGARPVRFVGQGSRDDDKGLTQKEQKEILDAFRAGDYNLLVATSVGEEGLDIPATDMVVFYEPVPSAIRLIQRRGRTGRNRPGEVYVLITENSRDEAAYWSSRHKEQRMRSLLSAGQVELDLPTAAELAAAQPAMQPAAQPAPRDTVRPPGAAASAPKQRAPPAAPARPVEVARSGPAQATLDKTPAPTGPRIVIDHREFASAMARELARRGAVLEPQQLAVGDYRIGSRVGVERKTGGDFVRSLMDGSLFQQVRALAQEFRRPVLLMVGSDLYTARRIDPKAIRGALATIAVDYGVPLLHAADAGEAAELLLAMAARETRTPGATPLRAGAGELSPVERQRFLVEGLPGVSAVLARRLLTHFGSVAAVFEASDTELRAVHGVGPLIASAIREAVTARYEP